MLAGLLCGTVHRAQLPRCYPPVVIRSTLDTVRSFCVAFAIFASACDLTYSVNRFDATYDPTHDEDGDNLADTADSCPGVPGVQLDTDGDGVGDQCDPHLMRAGDRIAMADYFAAEPIRFSLDDPAKWSVHDDVIETVAATDMTDSQMTLQVIGQEVSVELKLTPLAYDPVDSTPPQPNLTVGIAYTTAMGGCDFTSTMQTNRQFFKATAPTSNDWNQNVVALPNSVIDLRLSVDSTRATCRFNGQTSVTMARPGELDANPVISIAIRHMTARIQYVIAYSTP